MDPYKAILRQHFLHVGETVVGYIGRCMRGDYDVIFQALDESDILKLQYYMFLIHFNEQVGLVEGPFKRFRAKGKT